MRRLAMPCATALGTALPGRATLAAAGLGVGLTVLPGAVGGMYFPGPWLWTTVALAALLGLALVNGRTLGRSRAEIAMLAALAGLAAWQLLSTLWSIEGADSTLEARRTLLYLTAFAAVLVCVTSSEVAALLTGVVAGVVALAGFAVLQRALGTEPAPLAFEGTALSGSLDYSNALGILAAIGALLAIGFAALGTDRLLRRACGGAVVILVVALALSESRGAWLALVVGLVLAFVVADSAARRPLFASLVVLAPAGALALGLALGLDGGWMLLALTPAIAVLFVTPPARLGWGIAAGAAVVAVAATVVLATREVSYSLGNRPDYWRAAIDEIVADPILGSGAGSFGEAWRPEDAGVEDARNAHNLYLETLAELGPVGLALVAVVVLVPILVGIRRRGAPVVPGAVAAYAAFAVHAGLDWDWQMPAVVLPALSVAAALLIVARERES